MHSLNLYLFVLLLLNNVNEVGGVAAQRRTDYQALTWIPQLSSSQCAVTPISEQ